jgi:hypothetical protein
MAGTAIIEEAHTPTCRGVGARRLPSGVGCSKALLRAGADIDEGGAAVIQRFGERAGEVFRILGIGALTAESLHHPR